VRSFRLALPARGFSRARPSLGLCATFAVVRSSSLESIPRLRVLQSDCLNAPGRRSAWHIPDLAGQHLRGWDERRQAVDKAGRNRDLLTRNGIGCPTRTGSFEFEAASGVYTELQCGSYIFMDADYGRNLDRDGEPTKAFEPSLFVWATVMSRPAETCAIVDAGLKAFAFDPARRSSATSPPRPMSAPPTSTAGSPSPPPRTDSGFGDKIRLIPGHCDPTVNDWYVCVRANGVEQLWPITARGAVY
jgi:3-hydroxy-D-aspartate aldolase